MAEIPACLIMGTGQRDPEVIIKGIFGEEALPNAEIIQGSIPSFKWPISTKYYTSMVKLCCVREVSQLACWEDIDVHAFVLYINEERNTLAEVDHLLKSCSNLDLEVKILVCDQCSSEEESSPKLSKLQVQQWCIQNGFELVETNPAEVPDPDDDFPETLGIPRIIQALHAYPWPNLIMKDSSAAGGEQIKCKVSLPTQDSGDSKEIEYERLGADGGNEETTLEDMECFEQLFGQLNVIRNKASSLQGDERRAYAEKMAVAFWKALGGDDREIEESDSDGD